MNKYLLLLTLLSILLFSCKRDVPVIPDTPLVAAFKLDTVISFRNDTLVKTWKDTIMKVVKDPLYQTKNIAVLLKKDSVIVIKYIAAQTSKINILFLGTSITYGSTSIVGTGVPIPANKTYPADVSTFFGGSIHYGGWFNFGLPGAIVDDVVGTEIPQAIAKKATPGFTETVAFLEIGINDCASGYAAADIYSSIKSAHALLQQQGIQTIVLTPTPFNNNVNTLYNNAVTAEAVRQQLITMLVNGWKNDIGAKALINVGSDKYVGKFSGNTGFDLKIFQPDGIHFTPLGYSIIADHTEKTIFYLK